MGSAEFFSTAKVGRRLRPCKWNQGIEVKWHITALEPEVAKRMRVLPMCAYMYIMYRQDCWWCAFLLFLLGDREGVQWHITALEPEVAKRMRILPMCAYHVSTGLLVMRFFAFPTWWPSFSALLIGSAEKLSHQVGKLGRDYGYNMGFMDNYMSDWLH